MKGPYRVQPLKYSGGGRYDFDGDPTDHATLASARAHVRSAYDRTGVVPDVFDADGKLLLPWTNDEVSLWGLK